MLCWKRFLVIVISAVAMMGCIRNAGNVHITATEAETAINASAADVTLLAMKALSKDPASLPAMKDRAKIAQSVIETVVIPFLEGKDLNTLTMATANEALALLDGKIDPTLKNVIQLAINGALVFLNLPDNPAENLSAEKRTMILGLLRGVSSGLAAFQGWDGPASRDAVTVPVVREMSWRYGGEKP